VTITTGSTATTITVTFPCDGDLPSDEGCRWEEMHHLDDEGRHWCPTGFMYCHEHGGVGSISGPGACQLWGEFA
jgi:hypothetical protein